MNVNNKKKILTSVLCLLAVSVGFVIGNSLHNGESNHLSSAVSPLSGDIISDLRTNLYPLCKSQMLQFALIFLFGLTPYAHISNFLILGLRGASLGYGTAVILSGDDILASAVCFALSFALITAVMIIFAVYLADGMGRLTRTQDGHGRLKPVLNCFTLFFMTSGASVLIKILPILIFGGN